MTSVLSFVLALLMTTALIPVCRRYASHVGLVDEPGQKRRVHTQVIPRSGGIAIVLGALIAAAVWLPSYQHYLPFIGCICIIAFFGLLDDLTELPSSIKFVGQLIAAFWFIYAYGGITQLPFFPLDSAPTALCLFLSFMFLLGITNAVNLSDGLDGLAAGNSLLSLGLLAVFAAQIGEVGYLVLALTATGGLLGFLRFNTHPASIFMGDTGSQFIGFTAAALTILLLQTDSLPVSPMLPVLIFGLPILDTLSVMGVRLVRGRPMFKADRSHLHHQLLEMGFQHYQVVAILYSLQAVVVGLAYFLRYESDLLILATYLAFCAVVLSLILWGRLSRWRSRASQPETQIIERRNLWLRKLEWYHLHTAKVLAVAVSVFFVAGAWSLDILPKEISQLALITAAVLLAIQLLIRKEENMALVSRLTCFTVTAFLVYGLFGDAGANSQQNLAIDLYLVSVAAALFLAIRVTRKHRFRLDNQDYLVLLLVGLAPLVLLEQFEGAMITRSVLRLAILVYACEYVASKGRHTRPALERGGARQFADHRLSVDKLIKDFIQRMNSKSFKRISSTVAAAVLIAGLSACTGSDERQAEYLARAQEHFDAGNYDKAGVDVRNALQINGDNVEARYLYALLFEKENNLREMVANLRFVIDLDPNHIPARIKYRHGARGWPADGRGAGAGRRSTGDGTGARRGLRAQKRRLFPRRRYRPGHRRRTNGPGIRARQHIRRGSAHTDL